MGVCIQVMRHILAAKRDGVSYARTAMIGRQSLHVSVEQVQEAMQHFLGQTLAPTEVLTLMGDGFLEGILRALGASRIEAVDYSAYEGATIVHDMNQPLPDEYKGQFTAVIDGGSLEHVFDFPCAVRNCMEMLAVGGHFLGITCANNFMGHGFYQFSPELFYRVFSPENGFRVEKMFVCETHAEGKWYAVADPQAVGDRVTLVNRQPTFLMVLARKTQDKELFTRTPLQSDYKAVWKQPAPVQRDHSSKRIEELNLSLFDTISSQTSAEDRLSLLGVQRAVRRTFGDYVYLEIGSHLGGSIQPHLVDSKCKKIYSIDKRPLAQPDARGEVYDYPDNSSERMLHNLNALGEGLCSKVTCFDDDAKNVSKEAISEKPDICFIDGEHTREAVISDFNFCLSVAKPETVILFHDAMFLFDALADIENNLRRKSIAYTSGLLRGVVYAIFLGTKRISRDPLLHKMIRERKHYSRRRLRQARTPAFLQRPMCGITKVWHRFLLNASPRVREAVIQQSPLWSDAVFHQELDLHAVDRILVSTKGIRDEYLFRIALLGQDYESEYWIKSNEDRIHSISINEFTVTRRDSDTVCRTIYVGGPKTTAPVKVSLMFV